MYRTLISADVYRDGGSLEAIFKLDDGGFESILLSVLPWGYPSDAKYGALRICSGADGAEKGRLVDIRSEEEVEILRRISLFLEHPEVNIPFSHKTDDDFALEKVRMMICEIPNRIGEPIRKKGA